MIRNAVKGLLAAYAVSVAYNWYSQKASFPNGVPLGNLLQPKDASWILLGVGALAGATLL